jgi:hypothetical protein
VCHTGIVFVTLRCDVQYSAGLLCSASASCAAEAKLPRAELHAPKCRTPSNVSPSFSDMPPVQLTRIWAQTNKQEQMNKHAQSARQGLVAVASSYCRIVLGHTSHHPTTLKNRLCAGAARSSPQQPLEADLLPTAALCSRPPWKT